MLFADNPDQHKRIAVHIPQKLYLGRMPDGIQNVSTGLLVQLGFGSFYLSALTRPLALDQPDHAPRHGRIVGHAVATFLSTHLVPLILEQFDVAEGPLLLLCGQLF